jgi:DNA-binding NarL/FixJ family response regulator
MPVTVAILAAEAAAGQRLARALNRACDLHCTGLYADLAAAVEAFRHGAPDVALIDEEVARAAGFVPIARLKAAVPSLQLVLLHESNDLDWLVQAIARGVSGLVDRAAPVTELFQALEEVARGGSPIGSRVARRLIERVQNRPAANAHTDHLSLREREILDYLIQGYPYKQIADALTLSIDTVRTYVRRLYGKLNVRSRAHAILKCQAPGSDWGESDFFGQSVLAKQSPAAKSIGLIA